MASMSSRGLENDSMRGAERPCAAAQSASATSRRSPENAMCPHRAIRVMVGGRVSPHLPVWCPNLAVTQCRISSLANACDGMQQRWRQVLCGLRSSAASRNPLQAPHMVFCRIAHDEGHGTCGSDTMVYVSNRVASSKKELLWQAIFVPPSDMMTASSRL